MIMRSDRQHVDLSEFLEDSEPESSVKWEVSITIRVESGHPTLMGSIAEALEGLRLAPDDARISSTFATRA